MKLPSLFRLLKAILSFFEHRGFCLWLDSDSMHEIARLALLFDSVSVP